MAVSSSKRTSVFTPSVCTGALLWCIVSPSAAVETVGRAKQEVTIDADWVEFDDRNNTALLHKVRIRQGDLEVKAQEALANGGVNFANNQWTFSRDVLITTKGGSLRSDRADVTFLDNRVTRATIVGSPASFEQLLENGKDSARGQAGTIEYDVTAQTVTLQDDAYLFLTDGNKEIRSPSVVYNIGKELIMAGGDNRGDERVHITITPPEKTSAPDSAPQTAPKEKEAEGKE